MTEDRMNFEGENDRRSPAPFRWEQHISTILTSLILLSVVWVGAEILEQGKKQIALEGEIDTVNVQLENFSVRLSDAGVDRYTGEDAKRDKELSTKNDEVIYKMIESNTRRIIKLEHKHDVYVEERK